jgi:hypothetical protein|tara:strand:+ start:1739 stop:2047 length:309 start_codon:yes stop_codon:yes gene_type:complete
LGRLFYSLVVLLLLLLFFLLFAGTNLLAARVFEKAPPIMVVQFTAQQIHCVTDKHGKIVEGEEDAITNNFYVLAMQRDWDEEENELKWKIVEFMVLGSMPYN